MQAALVTFQINISTVLFCLSIENQFNLLENCIIPMFKFNFQIRD